MWQGDRLGAVRAHRALLLLHPANTSWAQREERALQEKACYSPCLLLIWGTHSAQPLVHK